MPSSPRSAQVDLESTPYYHCIARCVRRAFLCGDDPYTGENFDHRKSWFLTRMKLATEAFAIDVCSYAILSNHFHVVLRVDVDRVNRWSDETVLRRYAKLFPKAARQVRDLPEAERALRLTEIRSRLADISWFMRVLCEYVARRANREDNVTGRFWEGRFKSQALLDEAALYTCMSYVDLNPMRAGAATSLESSDFTSIKQRLDQEVGRGRAKEVAVPLAPLHGEPRGRGRKGPVLDFRFRDYVELLEWTSRCQRKKSTGQSRGAPTGVLQRLGVEAGAWLEVMHSAALTEMTSVGSEASMRGEADRRGLKWLRGKRAAANLFRHAI